MKNPITQTEKDILERIEKMGIDTDITKRWEQGIDHHPEAKKLAKEIAAIDWMFGDDGFGFKFGGDGDNGDELIYLLNILFDLKDAEARNDKV